jgi:MipA family protein
MHDSRDRASGLPPRPDTPALTTRLPGKPWRSVIPGICVVSALLPQVSVADETSASWQITAGAGAVNAPRYPGSRDQWTRGLPLIRIEYGRFFLGSVPNAGAGAGLGAYILRDEHWQFGVAVGGDTRKPRRASDAPVLHGWGDIPSTVRATAFGSYTLDWFVIRGSVSPDIGGKHEGVLASLEMQGRYRPIAGLTLSAGPEAIFGDSRYRQTFFGISAAQSLLAAVPEHTVKSGLNEVRIGAGADYQLTEHVSLGAHVAYGRLQGGAADSPVTTDKTQHSIAVFAAYRFK